MDDLDGAAGTPTLFTASVPIAAYIAKTIEEELKSSPSLYQTQKRVPVVHKHVLATAWEIHVYK